MKVGTQKELEKLSRQSWRNMKHRCAQPETHKNYKYYGAKGIKVCDRWLESYENFVEDMGTCPFLDFTIERKNNSEGYTPENCKWRSRVVQQWNRDLGDERGVTFYEPLSKWCARLGIGGKRFHLGYFETKEEALEEYASHARLIDWLIEQELLP
jgi:hypothetical protein